MWLLCKVAPARTFSNPCHMSGERSPKPTTTRPPRGETSILSWLVALWYGVRRLFEAFPRLFGAFSFSFSQGFMASGFFIPPWRSLRRSGSVPPPKRVTRPTPGQRGQHAGVNGAWCERERARVKSVRMRMGVCVCTWGNACECGRAWWGDACRAVFRMAAWLVTW